jgi:hypothetical protein
MLVVVRSVVKEPVKLHKEPRNPLGYLLVERTPAGRPGRAPDPRAGESTRSGSGNLTELSEEFEFRVRHGNHGCSSVRESARPSLMIIIMIIMMIMMARG